MFLNQAAVSSASLYLWGFVSHQWGGLEVRDFISPCERNLRRDIVIPICERKKISNWLMSNTCRRQRPSAVEFQYLALAWNEKETKVTTVWIDKSHSLIIIVFFQSFKTFYWYIKSVVDKKHCITKSKVTWRVYVLNCSEKLFVGIGEFSSSCKKSCQWSCPRLVTLF